MKPILLALVGPTGVGKTQVSLDVASALNHPLKKDEGSPTT